MIKLTNPRSILKVSKTTLPFGISFAERIIGVVLLIIGGLLAYYTQTHPSAAGAAAPFGLAAGIILVIVLRNVES